MTVQIKTVYDYFRNILEADLDLTSAEAEAYVAPLPPHIEAQIERAIQNIQPRSPATEGLYRSFPRL